MPRTSSSVSTTCWRAGPPFAFLFACGITNKGCPTLRGLRLLRNSKNVSHIVIRCFRNHNILWFSTLKFEFRNSLGLRRVGTSGLNSNHTDLHLPDSPLLLPQPSPALTVRQVRTP